MVLVGEFCRERKALARELADRKKNIVSHSTEQKWSEPLSGYLPRDFISTSEMGDSHRNPPA